MLGLIAKAAVVEYRVTPHISIIPGFQQPISISKCIDVEFVFVVRIYY